MLENENDIYEEDRRDNRGGVAVVIVVIGAALVIGAAIFSCILSAFSV